MIDQDMKRDDIRYHDVIYVIFFSFVALSLTHGLILVPAILVFFDKTHNGNVQTVEDAKYESNDGSKGSTDGMKYDLGRDDTSLDSFGGKVESNDGSKGSSDGMKYDLGRDDTSLDSFGGKAESNDGCKGSTDGMKYDLGRDCIFFDTDLASDVEISSRSDSSDLSDGSSFYAYASSDEGNDEGVC
ncbi:predicted protein [Chaetoceros tenuissimus]|uniref:Uncharacterized protein n=1 Tax=Chaetoceros tenuissimus TaxID=426638 RepID=A0AAD3D884_9STRA|nr:predicted protein [Chaetoceros tenuissimus]